MIKKLIFPVILVFFSAFVISDSVYNFLSKGYADTLYCPINGDCSLNSLTVNHFTYLNSTNATEYCIGSSCITSFGDLIHSTNTSWVKENQDYWNGTDINVNQITSYGNITFRNSSNDIKNILYTKEGTALNLQTTGGMYVNGQLGASSTIQSANDIITTGTGDDIGLGCTGIGSTCEVVIYQKGYLWMNTSGAINCASTANAGAFWFNTTTMKFNGCNGTGTVIMS